MAEDRRPKTYNFWGGLFAGVFCVGVALTIWWCYRLGAGAFEISSLAFALRSASFAVGGALGFIFTIFGDEQEPFGKIRDAMIAVASGLTGVGFARATDFGQLLGKSPPFQSKPRSQRILFNPAGANLFFRRILFYPLL